MLKNYELLYILHPDLEGSSDKISEKVTGFITRAGGEVTNQEDWGKRKMAYPIAKNDFGVYVLVYFTLESGQLPELEHNLKLAEEVMRFMVVVLPEVIETKKAAPKAKKEAKAPVKAEKPAKEEKKEEAPVAEEVKEDKPKRATAKKVKEKVAEEPKAEEKPKAKKTTKKEEKPAEAEEERLKKLDEKLEEILGE